METESATNRRGSAEISLTEFLLNLRIWYRYLLSKWLLIVTLSLFGGLLGLGYALWKKTAYVAVSTFVLEDADKAGGLGQYAGLASMMGIDLSGNRAGGIFQGDNILELYKSKKMIAKTLLTEVGRGQKRDLLINWYIDFNKLRQKWDDRPDLQHIRFTQRNEVIPNAGFSRLQDSVLDVIVEDINKKYLKVEKPDKKLNIIEATVTAKDEVFAKTFNEEIVRNVNDFYVLTKTRKSLSSVKMLQRKTDSIRRVMNGSIYSAAAIVDATPNLNLVRQKVRLVPMQRSQFAMEANKSVLGELVTNLEMAKINMEKEVPLIELIDVPNFPLKKIELKWWKGLIAGCFIAGFLTVLFLWLGKVYTELIKRAE